jgi:glycosyltransferase involved in cell wall biosynthesis
MGFTEDLLSKNAMGGTELMKYRLKKEFSEEYLSDFKIFVSRSEEEVDKDKINLYWHHDLPQDTACHHLKNEGWRKYDFFIFVSNWQMQQFNSLYGIPYQRSIVLQNAIDPIGQENKNNEKIKIIYHTTPHRGLSILVPVFEKLAEKYVNIELDVYSSFKIYGWEERNKEYETLFDRCRNHPKINYYDTIPNAELKGRLAKAHIFAYPSIWTETSCIALMEAMSAKLLCVHPNTGALYETAGGVTRMYQWCEDVEIHALRFYYMLDQAISDVEGKNHLQEIEYVKLYADNRFNWEHRLFEWGSFFEMVKGLKNR